MYKELAIKRKLEGVFLWFILLTGTISLSDTLAKIQLESYLMGQILSNICYLSLAAVTLIGIEKYKTDYKYSIIANQFIIHAVRGNLEKLLVNIKLSDIVFIGDKEAIQPKVDISSTNKYVTSFFKKKCCCCIYRDGEEYRRFYFEPSKFLLDKIKISKEKLSA